MAQVGRPLETLESLPTEWREILIDLYRDGGSDVEAKALIYEWRGSFSNDLWDRWLKDEPDFSETIKNGHILSEAKFTKLGRTNLTNKDFNYTGWYMQMKNRFAWKDKSEVDHTTDGKPITPIIRFTNE